MELRMVKGMIETALLEQFFVVALLDNGAVLDHQNGIGILDGGKAMGDDKAGLILHQRGHRALNLDLGAGIHIGGRFVQNQNRRVGKKGAGDGDELLLPFGDIHTIVGKDGIIPIGQAFDVGIDFGGFGGGVNFFGGSIFAAVDNIVVDGSVEQPGILQHHIEGKPQIGALELLRGGAIEADLPALGIIKPHQKIDNGGLSRSGGADDRHRLPFLCVDVDILQNNFVFGITKGDILQADIPLNVLQLFGIGEIFLFGLFVQNGKDPLCRRKGGLKFVQNIGKFVDGPCKFAGILDKLRHPAQGNEKDGSGGHRSVLREHIENAAHHRHQGEGKIIDHIDGREEQSALVFRFIEGVHRFVVDFIEPIGDGILHSVGRDGAGAGQHLFGKAVELAVFFGALAEERAHHLGAIAGKEDGDRHRQNKDQNHRLGDLPHKDQRTHHGIETGHHLNQIVGEGGIDGIDIIGKMADDIAGRVGIEIADRQGGQFFKHLLAHFIDDLLAQPDHHNGKNIGKQCRDQIAAQHQPDVFPYCGEIHPA